MKAFATWTVLPHGPLEPLAPSVWRLEGSVPKIPLKRVMTLVRHGDGELFVHNGIAVDDATVAELERLGRPTTLVVPNGYHRLDAAAWKARYPNVRVVCPAGARARVEEVVPVDATYEGFAGDAQLSLETLDGTAQAEGVVVVRPRAGEAGGATLVFNDVIFNQPHLPGLPGLVLRLLGSTGDARVTRIARLLVLKDRRAFGAHLLRLAALPELARIVVSHGHVLDHAPAETLRRLAARLGVEAAAGQR